MQDKIKNPCIRCGKPRIVDKTWKEYVGKSLLTYVTTVCPDKECQKAVEQEIAAKEAKRSLLEKKRNEARLSRGRTTPLKHIHLN